MSGLQKVWKYVISTFFFSLCMLVQMHLSSFLKCLKAACTNPNNKQQDDDENPIPHSNDSFPVHLGLKLPTETGCLCWVLCLQPALSLSALLGDTHWILANCPPHPAAHDTLWNRVLLPTHPWCCCAWTLLHRRVWEGSVCGLGLSAKCQCAEVKRMIPILETLSSSGMGRKSELSDAGLAVPYSMTHHVMSFWTFLKCVSLCIGRLVFWQNGQWLWSLTFTSPKCPIFSISGFFFLFWENMVDKTDFWVVLNWAPAFHCHRQPLTSWAQCFQARHVLKAGTSLL